jgi:hypothetical protein
MLTAQALKNRYLRALSPGSKKAFFIYSMESQT